MKTNFRFPEMKTELKKTALWAAVLCFTLVVGQTAYAQTYHPHSGDDAYVAQIHAINPKLTNGQVSGEATFIERGNKLFISVVVKGLHPNMSYLIHIHGFKGSSERQSFCPGLGADVNGDGIIDLMETHKSSGVTLIPFNDAPAKLKILSNTYPVTNSHGVLTYQMTVSLSTLKAAVRKAYGITDLDLDHRVIFIHGVPKGTNLPKSVKSLTDVPNYVTVPIACGKIVELDD